MILKFKSQKDLIDEAELMAQCEQSEAIQGPDECVFNI